MTDNSATFTAVDLSRLPAPDVVETLSYEQIYEAKLALFLEDMPDFDATVESDPVVKLLQRSAYDELLARQRTNDAAKAVMVAHATDADLDNLAALFGVTRKQLTEAEPLAGIAATFESDDDLRRRLVLAPEGFSVAGPEGAYIFHSLSADPDVLDASATSPGPGEVVVTVLSRTGDGTADEDLIDAVAAYVSDDTRRPLTDFVTVQSAEIVEYEIEATLTTYSGPDGSIVLAKAIERLQGYIADNHRLGRDITISGIHGALNPRGSGVQNVELIQPEADIVVDRTQAAYCTAVDVTHAGVGE